MVRKALLIEDDPDIQSVIATNIGDVGLTLDTERDGEVGLARVLAGEYAILLVDLNLPGMGGMEICRRVRQQKADLPILILSARASEIDKVSGLQLGADDYVTKPFSVRELLARISALLRRADARSQAAGSAADEILDFGKFKIDIGARSVSWDGHLIDLTQTEFELLAFLAKTPGRVFSREELIESVLGYRGESYVNAVNPHLSRLGKKLTAVAPGTRFFRSARGVGYAFVYGQAGAQEDSDE